MFLSFSPGVRIYETKWKYGILIIFSNALVMVRSISQLTVHPQVSEFQLFKYSTESVSLCNYGKVNEE